MRKTLSVLAGLAFLGVGVVLAAQPEGAPGRESGQPSGPKQPAPEVPVSPYVLGFKVMDIGGKEVDLSQYKGKVVVIVNVASKCGFTKQYEGLQALYEQKQGQGLVVLGFPANDFNRQEPGTDAEIKAFCEGTFKVTFPMFAKVQVKGEGAHPLYKHLAAQPAPIGGAPPRWNFTKFVVDREGNVVARFDAEKTYVGTARLEPGLLAKVEELLAKK
jgi:glutathione peroxidase